MWPRISSGSLTSDLLLGRPKCCVRSIGPTCLLSPLKISTSRSAGRSWSIRKPACARSSRSGVAGSATNSMEPSRPCWRPSDSKLLCFPRGRLETKADSGQSSIISRWGWTWRNRGWRTSVSEIRSSNRCDFCRVSSRRRTDASFESFRKTTISLWRVHDRMAPGTKSTPSHSGRDSCRTLRACATIIRLLRSRRLRRSLFVRERRQTAGSRSRT